MTLASGKVVFISAIVFIAIGWCISENLVRWERADYGCVKSNWWYGYGEKQPWFGVGSLRFYYQPLAFGCPPDYRFDKREYKLQNGIIVPK